MKKGFTLVELLIVVVVLVTLMTMVVRLGTVGDDVKRRATTINRMQRLENCLSGYYAAFGNYPPVKVHGTRDIYAVAESQDVQNQNDEVNDEIWGWKKIGDQEELRAWQQVSAACRSQPVEACFPFPSGWKERIERISDELKIKASDSSDLSEDTKAKLEAGFDDGVGNGSSIGRFNPYTNEVDWRKLQLFKFGLMSYLLPRYLVMMNGDESFYTKYRQWTDNNDAPSDPFNGNNFGWSELHNSVINSGKNRSDLARVINIPTQAVTARWMPNLEGMVSCEHSWTLFGINITSGDYYDKNLRNDNFGIDVYTPGGGGSHSQQYVLDKVTVRDGWGNQFYYYSPSPHQGYVLWSAGPNGRTFPPWIPRESMGDRANPLIGLWIEDDITSMSN